MSRSKTEHRIMDDEERERFLDQFNTRWRAPRRDWLACRLMLEAGLRVGEVVALRPEHIRWKTCKVIVREGKGSLDRRTFVSDDLRDELAAWVEDEKLERTDLLLPTRNGNQLEPNHLRRRVKRAARDAELAEADRISPHSLRHTFATSFLERTGNLEKLRRLMGHADISTTQIYLNYADEDLEETARAYANGQPGAHEEEDEELEALLERADPDELRAALKQVVGSAS